MSAPPDLCSMPVSMVCRNRDRGRLADLLPALVLMVGGLSATVGITLFGGPSDDLVAVIFAPGAPRWDNWSAVQAAGGRIIRERLDGTVLIVQPDDAQFSARVRQAGAWLVVNPRLPGACGSGAMVRSGRSSLPLATPHS